MFCCLFGNVIVASRLLICFVFRRALHLGLLYCGSLLVLVVYSILYGLTAKKSQWLGAITSAAVIILGIHFIDRFQLPFVLHLNN